MLTGQIPANWQHAAPDAYSGAFVRPCLRLAVRCSGGLCCAAAALGPVRDASDVSGGYCDGLEAADLRPWLCGLVYRPYGSKGRGRGVCSAAYRHGRQGGLSGAWLQVVLLGLGGKAFTAQAFLAGALLNAVPGIIVQLVLIPAVMAALQKAGAVKEYAE